MIGATLGTYHVLEKLGEGGMGEVYRAVDTTLKRQVAIKVLPAVLAADPERLARFRREAEVLASLNHPNIAHIYGVVDGGSAGAEVERHPPYARRESAVHALVIELVEGPTLSDRIAQGPIPTDEALTIARQIAQALEGAHEQGIVHRDLKPANIKVREDGTVKVLDFGLAKLTDPPGAASGLVRADASLSPTITSPALATGVGVLLSSAASASTSGPSSCRAAARYCSPSGVLRVLRTPPV